MSPNSAVARIPELRKEPARPSLKKSLKLAR